MNAPSPAVLAIGASTGGPPALLEILSHLPAELPVGILIVQHMHLGFTANFVQRLNIQCQLSIQEASEGDRIEPGTVYIAPAGSHMTIRRDNTGVFSIQIGKSPYGMQHTPSVDVLMRSVAETCRNRAMGVLLTGMGVDGALGMKAIHDAGGWTLGQDAGSCVVYGMPRAAAAIGALSRVVPLHQICTEILAALAYKPAQQSQLASSHRAR